MFSFKTKWLQIYDRKSQTVIFLLIVVGSSKYFSSDSTLQLSTRLLQAWRLGCVQVYGAELAQRSENVF